MAYHIEFHHLVDVLNREKSSREPNQKKVLFGHHWLGRPPLTEQLPSQPSLLKRFSSLAPIGNFISLYH